jgi:transposase-like protein
MSALSRPEFHNEEAAFEHVERMLWENGPVCPHCGGVDRVTKVKANPEKRIRVGLWRCGQCKGQFTVKVGTVFEHARMPLHKILQAVYLMTSSKKGVSAHQLHRMLEVTYKTAWFLAHRIREAMRSGDLTPFGSGGGFVEVDETFIGRDKSRPVNRGYEHKLKVLALIDRDTGRTRMMQVEKLTIAYLTPIIQANVAAEAKLLTDDAGQYRFMHRHFAFHGTSNHTKGNYVNRPLRSVDCGPKLRDQDGSSAAKVRWIVHSHAPLGTPCLGQHSSFMQINRISALSACAFANYITA